MSVPSPAGAPPGWEDRALERSLAAARGRSSARARRLVDAARRLVAGGSTTFTIADVAAEAGVSLRTFYRYFAGRDGLLLALIEEDARTGAAVLDDACGAVESPLGRAQCCVVTLCALVVTGSGYAGLLVREHLRLAEEHPEELRAALGPLLDAIEAKLAAAAATGALRAVDRFDAATVLSLVLTHVQNAALVTPGQAAAGGRVWRFCRAALAPIGNAPS
jgi:AcrR family transcriptional regulator